MDQGWTFKKICESKLEDRRRIRRPRLIWLEDVEKDLCETKVKRWWQMADDREEKVYVIKEAKALKGPQDQGVST
jgi:hypothetical protein